MRRVRSCVPGIPRSTGTETVRLSPLLDKLGVLPFRLRLEIRGHSTDFPPWFPSSAWEPTSAKLRFASREAELPEAAFRSGTSERAVNIQGSVLHEKEPPAGCWWGSLRSTHPTGAGCHGRRAEIVGCHGLARDLRDGTCGKNRHNVRVPRPRQAIRRVCHCLTACRKRQVLCHG